MRQRTKAEATSYIEKCSIGRLITAITKWNPVKTKRRPRGKWWNKVIKVLSKLKMTN